MATGRWIAVRQGPPLSERARHTEQRRSRARDAPFGEIPSLSRLWAMADTRDWKSIWIMGRGREVLALGATAAELRCASASAGSTAGDQAERGRISRGARLPGSEQVAIMRNPDMKSVRIRRMIFAARKNYLVTIAEPDPIAVGICISVGNLDC